MNKETDRLADTNISRIVILIHLLLISYNTSQSAVWFGLCVWEMCPHSGRHLILWLAFIWAMAGTGITDWGGLTRALKKTNLWDLLNWTDCTVWHVLLTAHNPAKHYNLWNTGRTHAHLSQTEWNMRPRLWTWHYISSATDKLSAKKLH